MAFLGTVLVGQSLASLIGHWSFDEAGGETAFDAAGNRSGAIQGATRIPGRIGSGALVFDGVNDYVVVGGSGTPLDLTGPVYSIAWWQRWDGVNGALYQRAISKDDGEDYSGGYSLHIGPNNRMEFTHNNGPDRTWKPGYAPGPAWTHLAVTFNGSLRSLYVNGRLFATVATGGNLASDGNDPLLFGAGNVPSFGGVFQYFRGALDDIRIYDHVLATGEIEVLAEVPRVAITRDPRGVTVPVGSLADFRVELTVTNPGSEVVTYQWQKDGVNIPGATAPSYTAGPVSIRDSGSRFRVLVSLAGGTVTSAEAVLVVEPRPGLVGHWTFDEGQGTTAIERIGGANGQIENATYVPGRIGGHALRFNGVNSVVKVGGVGSPLNLVGRFYTLSWWQQWDGRNGNLQIVISMDDGFGTGGGYSAFIHDTTFEFAHNNGPYQNWWTAFAPGTGWRHFALVFDGVKRTLYADGVALGSIATTGRLAAEGWPLWFGALRTGSGGLALPFQGALDDVRIYNLALNASEVLAIAKEAEVPVLQPVLAPSGQLILQWNVANPPWVLETGDPFKPAQPWQTVPQTPLVIDGRNLVVVEPLLLQENFRLRRSVGGP